MEHEEQDWRAVDPDFRVSPAKGKRGMSASCIGFLVAEACSANHITIHTKSETHTNRDGIKTLNGPSWRHDGTHSERVRLGPSVPVVCNQSCAPVLCDPIGQLLDDDPSLRADLHEPSHFICLGGEGFQNKNKSGSAYLSG